MFGMRPLERQRRALRQDPQVRRSDPRRQIIPESVRLLVGPGDHHERVRGRQRRPARGEMAGPRGGGHTKDARFRQMGPKGVDERGNAAITAA
jgi:hypothetical protein